MNREFIKEGLNPRCHPSLGNFMDNSSGSNNCNQSMQWMVVITRAPDIEEFPVTSNHSCELESYESMPKEGPQAPTQKVCGARALQMFVTYDLAKYGLGRMWEVHQRPNEQCGEGVCGNACTHAWKQHPCLSCETALQSMLVPKGL